MSMFGFFRQTLYVMISPELLTIKNLSSGQVISEVPEVAISKSPRPKILGVGSKARKAALLEPSQIVNPFAHPRSLVSDFTVAEQLLKYQVLQVTKASFFRTPPSIIMHPLGTPAGGFTQIERRALRELALGAGASTVYLKEGEPLTDGELLQIKNQGVWHAKTEA